MGPFLHSIDDLPFLIRLDRKTGNIFATRLGTSKPVSFTELAGLLADQGGDTTGETLVGNLGDLVNTHMNKENQIG